VGDAVTVPADGADACPARGVEDVAGDGRTGCGTIPSRSVAAPVGTRAATCTPRTERALGCNDPRACSPAEKAVTTREATAVATRVPTGAPIRLRRRGSGSGGSTTTGSGGGSSTELGAQWGTAIAARARARRPGSTRTSSGVRTSSRRGGMGHRSAEAGRDLTRVAKRRQDATRTTYKRGGRPNVNTAISTRPADSRSIAVTQPGTERR
jgi:hypothetical protein